MKHKHFLFTLFFIVVFILSGQNVWAQVPQTMSYQGVLMKAKGTLVSDGQYTLTFKLYDAAEGGKVLWSETQTIRVEDGLFNAALGRLNSLDIPFDQPYWLAVTIGDGEEVSRRMQLTSSAYSLQAQTVADKAITGKKIADGQVVRSINSVTDNVKLIAGENVTITQKGDELVISANSPKGDELVTLAKAGTKGPDQEASESVVENLLVNGKFGVKDPTSGNFTMAVLNDSVGIGTTSPSAKLDVVGTTELNGLVTINNNTVSQALNVTGFVDISNEIRLGDFGAPNDPGYTWLGDVDTGMFRAANNELGFTTGGTEKVRISSTGNVGIGTTSPATLLHLRNVADAAITLEADTDNATEADNAYIRFLQDGSRVESFIGYAGDAGVGPLGTYTGALGNALVIGTIDKPTADIALQFGTGGTVLDQGSVRMTITPDFGYVGIGTTSPSFPLEMGSGAHVTVGGVWTNASSREYKENIRDLTLEEAMTALRELQPRRFNYKVDKQEEHVGFIAEDVPELLANKDRKGLSPMDIVAVLTKVVQEQQKKIEALEARLNGGQ